MNYEKKTKNMTEFTFSSIAFLIDQQVYTSYFSFETYQIYF
jgi:hypothetical protein